jgi:hypothetical protein
MAFSTKSAFMIAAERAQAERAQAERAQAEQAKRVRLPERIEHKDRYKNNGLTPEFFREQRRFQNVLHRKQLREERFWSRRVEVELLEFRRMANFILPMETRIGPIVRFKGGQAANDAGAEFEEHTRNLLSLNNIIHSHFRVHNKFGRDLTDIDAFVPFSSMDLFYKHTIVEMKYTVGFSACESIPEQIENQLSLFPDACAIVYTEDTKHLERLKQEMILRLDADPVFRGRWTIVTTPQQLLGLLRQNVSECQRQRVMLKREYFIDC